MSAPRTIASVQYHNGRFGRQWASLVRVAGGYRVHAYGDPFFYACPIEAKSAYRAFVEEVSA